MNLVITRLSGGLGNQMFQYAAGRTIALRKNATLKLDLSGFSNYSKRRYELRCFSIHGEAATDADLLRFGVKPSDQSTLVNRILRYLGVPAKSPEFTIYRERNFHFDCDLSTVRTPVYLDGYWQSERYFASHVEALRREFVPTAPLDQKNAALAARIDAVNAVSLHVRRGDFASDRRANRYHGTCSPDYYSRAVEHICGRVEAPHLFAFSDDPLWTRDNLRFDVPMTLVDINSPDCGYRDLQLMARCRHHVIANSSFSWWGAWLNPLREKIVVAPTRWFNTARNDTRDLIPAAWVRL